MKIRHRISYFASTAALALMTTLPFSVVADDTVAFGGVDVKEDSNYFYLGLIHAFNGLGVDGPAMKVFLGGGSFDYDTDPVLNYPGGNVDGDSRAADLLIGYRTYNGDYQLGFYAGVNYQAVLCREPGGGLNCLSGGRFWGL